MNIDIDEMTVLLVGHYGRGNLGDDAMLEGIKRLFPDDHELRVLAPRQVSGLRTCNETPVQLVRAGFESDWVWMGGGTFIHDETTNRRFLHRGLIKALAVFLVAKLTRCDLAYIGMGLGPLHTHWKRRVVRFLFSHADYVSLRDRSSIEEWNQCADKNLSDLHLTFDSCVALEPGDQETVNFNIEEPEIGINVLPYFKIYHDEPSRDDILLDTIVGACKQALAGRSPQFRIFTFNVKSGESEAGMASKVQDALSDFGDVEVVPYQSPQKTIADISACDAMIAMRYHGSMMGYVTRIPQIVLSYHGKCRALAREIGLPEHVVLDVESLQANALAQEITQLMEEPNTYVASRPVEDAHRQFKDTYVPEPFRS